LEAQLHAFVCALQALDGEAMRQAIDAFFEGLSPDIWDEQRLKAELIRCVSELMERIPAMIRIIGDLRLTEFDAASSIRNLPTFSQLHKRMLDIAEQYHDKMRQNAKNHDQLLIRARRNLSISITWKTSRWISWRLPCI
jgi:uncharacterized protein YdaU (DUF1376 family)